MSGRNYQTLNLTWRKPLGYLLPFDLHVSESEKPSLLIVRGIEDHYENIDDLLVGLLSPTEIKNIGLEVCSVCGMVLSCD